MNRRLYPITFLSLMLFCSLNVIADSTPYELPKPVSGIHVVPDSELAMSDETRKINAKNLKEFNLSRLVVFQMDGKA